MAASFIRKDLPVFFPWSKSGLFSCGIIPGAWFTFSRWFHVRLEIRRSLCYCPSPVHGSNWHSATRLICILVFIYSFNAPNIIPPVSKLPLFVWRQRHHRYLFFPCRAWGTMRNKSYDWLSHSKVGTVPTLAHKGPRGSISVEFWCRSIANPICWDSRFSSFGCGSI